MAIQAGLVGLPNVGKSTLFNALTKSEIPAENFPFCTINPHVAITAVSDKRLDKLAHIFGSKKKLPTTMQFVDIAGLVSGASKGEGLGNKFLSHVMEVDLIIHVLRCFKDPNITHVAGTIDPVGDFEVIVSELMLKDLDSLEKRETKVRAQIKKFQNSPKERLEFEQELELIKEAKTCLDQGDQQAARKIIANAKDEKIHFIKLLSTKKFLIAANLSDEDFAGQNFEANDHFKALVEKFGIEHVIPVSAKVEAELSQMSDEDATEMRKDFEFNHCGLSKVISKTYAELGLITFFTCGPKEAHAWSIPKGFTAPEAAGEIHSDLQRGFICVEVYNAQEMFEAGSEQNLKNSGKIRTEGKEYVIQDGDLLNVRFNV
ncbi:redox-regulated ATPase YchF [Candidatus Babeliales bacterium]|nr:redox-regulated ATPase YchF [Candidatus Babeliales bacterium]